MAKTPPVTVVGSTETTALPGADVITGPGVVNASNIDAVVAGAEPGMR